MAEIAHLPKLYTEAELAIAPALPAAAESVSAPQLTIASAGALDRYEWVRRQYLACTPKQRMWISAMLEHDWPPYHAGRALGFSTQTVYRWVHDERVLRILPCIRGTAIRERMMQKHEQ